MKKLGILGGMGPMAGAYFYRRIIENTGAKNDAEHIPVVLLGDASIPDRTESILCSDNGARAALLRGVDFLCRSGVDAIAVPCNTAHAYLGDMRACSRAPILDMPRLCVSYAAALGNRRLGVLCTRGCHVAGVYESAAAELAVDVVPLVPRHVTEVERLIYRQKAGERVTRDMYLPYIEKMYEDGADCVLLACTEISCVFDGAVSEGLVDALEILAKTTVALFKGMISEVEVGAFLRASAV